MSDFVSVVTDIINLNKTISRQIVSKIFSKDFRTQMSVLRQGNFAVMVTNLINHNFETVAGVKTSSARIGINQPFSLDNGTVNP